MGPFNRLFRKKQRPEQMSPEHKESAVGRFLGGAESLWVGLNDPRWSNRNYKSLAEEGYRKNVITHRAVRILSESAASIPLQLFRGDRQLDHHPLLDLLNRPNPAQGRATFVKRLMPISILPATVTWKWSRAVTGSRGNFMSCAPTG